MTKTIKLRPDKVPYSSIVGGGLTLADSATGQIKFVVSLRGVSSGITKEETKALSDRIAELISEHGLEVPAR